MKHTKGERLNIRFNRKIKLEFHSNRILAIFFHKVDMGNIYSSDSTCSDKPLNIGDGTKVFKVLIGGY